MKRVSLDTHSFTIVALSVFRIPRYCGVANASFCLMWLILGTNNGKKNEYYVPSQNLRGAVYLHAVEGLVYIISFVYYGQGFTGYKVHYQFLA